MVGYCRRAIGHDATAVTVAAQAFAQFRRAIQPENALAGKGEAERILRSATRRCALEHAHEAALARDPGTGANGCAVQGAALLVFVEGALGPDERAVVATHVKQCDACAAVLQRLQDAEPAFKLKPGTPLPVPVAREILTALVGAAPVSTHGGDETAVRDEALRLFVGDDPIPPDATPPAPAAAAADPGPPPARSPVVPPARAPVRPAPAAASRNRAHGTIARLNDRLRWAGRDRFGPSRPAMLLRGALRLAGVVVAAGAVGVLLGVGLSALTGANETPSPAPALPTSSSPGATTAAAPAGGDAKRPIEILDAAARPAASGSGAGARLSLRVRAVNATGGVLRSGRPALFVDGARVGLAPGSEGSAGNLLAPSLDPGASAEGTLRFELPAMTAGELAAARVRLRILAKLVPVEPVVAGPAAG